MDTGTRATNSTPRRRALRTTALAAAFAATLVAGTVQAEELVSVGADQYWLVTPAEDAFSDLRPHVVVQPAQGPEAKLPIVVFDGTQYTASMMNTVGDHADPARPMRALIAPERRLVLGVGPRPDYAPRSRQRDKVELAFLDKYRNSEMEVDIEHPEPRYVAFDVMFDPGYELPPNSHYLIHFQGHQGGMRDENLPGSGQPPFAIGVRGTTRGQPDPMAPIELRLQHRWSNAATPAMQTAILPDHLAPMQRGRWYRFALRLLPGYDGGQIAVWQWDLSARYDRCDAPDDRWNVPWGYRPTASGDARTDARRHMIHYSLGIYRKSHTSSQQLQLRNIRYGTRYDDVVPGPACA